MRGRPVSQQTRKPYETPRLISYGSIRNLTGGSGISGRDGALTNSKNNPPGQFP